MFLLFLILDAQWLIPISALSLGASCKHTKSALRTTPFSSATMLHWYYFPQLCWITQIIASVGTQSTLSFGISHSPGCSCSHDHCELSCLPCCLFFFVQVRPLLCIAPAFHDPEALGPSVMEFESIAVTMSQVALVDSRPGNTIFLLCCPASVASHIFTVLHLNAI